MHTEHGKQIIDNFLHAIAGITSTGGWSRSSTARSRIRAKVGSDKVICALSGGVDSAVAATLVSRLAQPAPAHWRLLMDLGTTKMIARKEGGIGWMIFNQPEKHNAVSYEMWLAVPKIIAAFEADPQVA